MTTTGASRRRRLSVVLGHREGNELLYRKDAESRVAVVPPADGDPPVSFKVSCPRCGSRETFRVRSAADAERERKRHVRVSVAAFGGVAVAVAAMVLSGSGTVVVLAVFGLPVLGFVGTRAGRRAGEVSPFLAEDGTTARHDRAHRLIEL